jgi:hypothetical protein
MNQDFFSSSNKDAAKSDIPEIPGLIKKPTDNKIWKMRFRIFNLDDGEDVEDIEEIYTKAANHKNKEEGIWIINEVGKFLDDGSYRMMVYWGEWKNEKTGDNIT